MSLLRDVRLIKHAEIETEINDLCLTEFICCIMALITLLRCLTFKIGQGEESKFKLLFYIYSLKAITHIRYT